MKVLFRINYAILMLAGFFLVAQQSFIRRYNKFYYEQGKIALANNEENKHLFFYEAKGIHQKEPLYTFSNEDVKVDFYEVSVIDHKVDDYVTTSLFPVIEFKADTNDSDLIYVLNLKRNMPGDESVYPYIMFNFLDLGFYSVDSGFDDMLPIMIGDSEYDLINKNIIGFEIFTTDDDYEIINEFIDVNFTFNKNSFPIRNELRSILKVKELNNKPIELSDEDITYLIEEKNILFQEYHNASKYNSILYLWFGIYFGVFIVSGYFVFFFHPQRKRLGRIKPTRGLKESIKDNK